MTLTDPTVLPRAIRLVEYLEAVRNLREQPIRDVAEYRDRRWWAGDIPAHPACVVTPTGEEPWLRVSKAQVPTPPEVPALIAPYLVFDVANPSANPRSPRTSARPSPGRQNSTRTSSGTRPQVNSRPMAGGDVI
jgi:hypothetical protein